MKKDSWLWLAGLFLVSLYFGKYIMVLILTLITLTILILYIVEQRRRLY